MEDFQSRSLHLTISWISLFTLHVLCQYGKMCKSVMLPRGSRPVQTVFANHQRSHLVSPLLLSSCFSSQALCFLLLIHGFLYLALCLWLLTTNLSPLSLHLQFHRCVLPVHAHHWLPCCFFGNKKIKPDITFYNFLAPMLSLKRNGKPFVSQLIIQVPQTLHLPPLDTLRCPSINRWMVSHFPLYSNGKMLGENQQVPGKCRCYMFCQRGM